MTTAHTAATASPARKTPVRDAVKNASSDIKKVVTKVSDSIKHGAERRQRRRRHMGTGVRAQRGKPAESEQPRVERSRGCYLLKRQRHPGSMPARGRDRPADPRSAPSPWRPADYSGSRSGDGFLIVLASLWRQVGVETRRPTTLQPRPSLNPVRTTRFSTDRGDGANWTAGCAGYDRR